MGVVHAVRRIRHPVPVQEQVLIVGRSEKDSGFRPVEPFTGIACMFEGFPTSTISISRCRGSMRSACLGGMRKNSGSNRSMSSMKAPHLHSVPGSAVS